jgi:tRNA threonylcarbamoyladenosine biosynthesis protein TsaB
MRILAIETVGTTGSAAALERDTLLGEQPLDAERGSARSLAPAIDQLLARVGWLPADVQLVAVATGPGSFTGLRIGVTTAKTFAYAVGCDVVGVPTLAAIATRAPSNVSRVWVVLNAQRGELFAAEFARQPDNVWREIAPVRIVAADAWLAALTPDSIVTGPGLEPLVDKLPKGIVALDRALWPATAEAVGKLGWARYQAGERTSPFDLVPQYVRRVAAEEKLAKRPT